MIYQFRLWISGVKSLLHVMKRCTNICVQIFATYLDLDNGEGSLLYGYYRLLYKLQHFMTEVMSRNALPSLRGNALPSLNEVIKCCIYTITLLLYTHIKITGIMLIYDINSLNYMYI